VGTIVIRRLRGDVIEEMKRQAAQAGRSMEEEARQTLTRTYASDRLQRQREFAERQLGRLRRGELPRSDIDSGVIIREMRDERDQQLIEAIEGRGGAGR
jgi:plasmid stability protein